MSERDPYRGIDWETEPDVERTGKVDIGDPPDIEIKPYSDQDIGQVWLNITTYAEWHLSCLTVQVADLSAIPCWPHRLMQRLILGITWDFYAPYYPTRWHRKLLDQAKALYKRVYHKVWFFTMITVLKGKNLGTLRRFLFPTPAEKVQAVINAIQKEKLNAD